MHFVVPKRPSETLLVPALDEIVPRAAANRRRLDATGVRIAGVPLAELRTRLRRFILELAKRDPDDGRPLVATGHQPGFFHPGILFKHAVVEQLAPGAIPVNVIADSDATAGLSVKVPARRGGVTVVEEVQLARADKGLVFEQAPKPDRPEFENRLGDARRAVATLDAEQLVRSLDRFAAIHREEYPRHRSRAALLTAYRQRYFPTPHVHEIALSSLCQSDEFRLFAVGLVEEAQRFASTHNAALARHRHARRIRTTINPFPDLKCDGAAVEVPLWYVADDGRRWPLHVEPGAKRTTVHAHGKALGTFSSRAQLDTLLGKVQLRPKAVALTLFLRLCAVDFFVHGVSGANYDRATDAIIRDAFGLEPPAYGVASLTLRLPLAFDDALERQMRDLRYRARRMTWNPDEFVAEAHPLREEKWQILTHAGERLSRQEHERIESVRVRLLDKIVAEHEAADAALADARARLVAQQRVGARDFPYFLYPLQVLQAACQAQPTTLHARKRA